AWRIMPPRWESRFHNEAPRHREKRNSPRLFVSCERKPLLRCLFRKVHALPQLLAGLEVRYVLLRHLHLLARLRIASGAGRPIVEAKAAEPADLDALPLRERLAHRVEDHLHRKLGILGDQLRKLRREAVDQLRFGHCVDSVNRWSWCRTAWPSAARPGWWCPGWRPGSPR